MNQKELWKCFRYWFLKFIIYLFVLDTENHNWSPGTRNLEETASVFWRHLYNCKKKSLKPVSIAEWADLDICPANLVVLLGVSQRLSKVDFYEMQVWFLGQGDLLEEEMATHSSILAWVIPWTEEPSGLQSMRLQSQTWLSTHAHKTSLKLPLFQHLVFRNFERPLFFFVADDPNFQCSSEVS